MAAAAFSAAMTLASGGTIDNQGIIAADGGGTITVYGFTNFSGGTLTGGTWQAAGSKSVLQLKGADIKTNAANLLLDGAGRRSSMAAPPRRWQA